MAVRVFVLNPPWMVAENAGIEVGEWVSGFRI
jgi:hypothetical protein